MKRNKRTTNSVRDCKGLDNSCLSQVCTSSRKFERLLYLQSCISIRWNSACTNLFPPSSRRQPKRATREPNEGVHDGLKNFVTNRHASQGSEASECCTSLRGERTSNQLSMATCTWSSSLLLMSNAPFIDANTSSAFVCSANPTWCTTKQSPATMSLHSSALQNIMRFDESVETINSPAQCNKKYTSINNDKYIISRHFTCFT